MLSIATALLAASAAVSAVPTKHSKRGGTASVTPHEQYSSSVGVPGCKINTNRVAYWPGSVSCDDICVKLTNGEFSTHVLKIDSSAGAHDISYDAWVYLQNGGSAKDTPLTGGGIDMSYEFVPVSECADLLDGGSLPLSASNSMNFAASCMSSDTWVGKNLKLLNILDPICKYGYDETCTVDFDVSNQPSCPSGLGNPAPLNLPVINIEYGTGKEVQG